MKVSALYVLRKTLIDLSSVQNKKLAYFCIKNLAKIEDYLTDVEKEIGSINYAKLAEYDKERLDICRKYAEKDESGNPIFIQNANNSSNFKIAAENRSNFEQEILDLKSRYKGELEAYNQAVQEHNMKLEQEVPAEFITSLHKIKYEDLPYDISGEQLKNIEPLVIESSDGN
jgi:uncharacterized LabA/DUF88 family protein